MVSIDVIHQDSQLIYKDLVELIKIPGPSGSCAQLGSNLSSIGEELPMAREIRNMVAEMERSDENIRIRVIEHHGNIVLAGGLKSEYPSKEKIRNIPIALGAHADEITFLITNKWHQDSRVLQPLCSPPSAIYKIKGHPFIHEEAEILGFREGKLKTIGFGRFHAVRERITDKEPPPIYRLDISIKN